MGVGTARPSCSSLTMWEGGHYFPVRRVLVVEDTPIRKLHSLEVPALYPLARVRLTDLKMLELRENLDFSAQKRGAGMKKNANLPALIFMFALLIVWQ